MTRSDSLSHGPSLWGDAGRRLFRNRAAVFGLVTLTLMVLATLIGPMLSPYEFDHMPLDDDQFMGAIPPNLSHWLGTDDTGRDLLTRILIGGRISFSVALAATLVSLLIGVTYGAVSAYVGGKTDAMMMRVVDVLYALPFTLLVILLITVFERSLLLLYLAIGVVEWLTMARIVRGQVMSLKQQEFIEACQILGYSTPRIVFRHLLPNVMGTVIIYMTLTIPSVMLLEAFLSFLGLGVQAPNASWGTLINDGTRQMEIYPWLLFAPAIALTLTLMALNFLGDGLRDALDPKGVEGA